MTIDQRLYLIFALALTLFLLWTSNTYADGPGDLDITFNSTGLVTTSLSSGNDRGFSVAIQPDKKIIVAGESNTDTVINSNFGVVRYNSNGSLDTTFNNTGVVTTQISGGDFGSSVAVQPNGKIVVAGYSYNNGKFDLALARYTITGTLDTTFNNTGFVTTSIGSTAYGYSVAPQPDGKIVVAGTSDTNGFSDLDLTLVRYTITGTLDTTFNNTGIVTTPISGSSEQGNSIALQSNDKIVVAGNSSNGGNTDIIVARYDSDGSLDNAFNNTGIVTTSIDNGIDFGRSVAIQSDDKIVVAGTSDSGTGNFDFVVIRYTTSGTLDTSFNTSGIVTTSISNSIDQGLAVAIQANDKIVVTGVGQNDFATARYLKNGSLDTTFNSTGIVTTQIGTGGIGFSVAIQPDGKIVVAGDSGNEFAVARYLGNFQTYLPIILKH